MLGLLIHALFFGHFSASASETTTTTTTMSAPRSIAKTIIRPMSRDPDGVGWMRSVMGSSAFPSLGPFLLLDHWGGNYAKNEAVSGSDHPHKGQATVSYILKGGIKHEDSAGNWGLMTKGSVQWMSAGNGVLHSEMHSPDMWDNGGECEGFQLWVNLPSQEKAKPPHYQDTQADDIPMVQKHNASVIVKVVAGQSLGVQATIQTQTPIIYLDVAIREGYFLEQEIPKAQQGFVYVFGGGGWFGGQLSTQSDTVDDDLVTKMRDARVAGDDTISHHGSTWVWGEAGTVHIMGDGQTFAAVGGTGGVRFLLLSGEELQEPIERYGPFVMNTRQEIQEAFRQYQSGDMGVIAGYDERERTRSLARRNVQARLKAEAAGTVSRLNTFVGPLRETLPVEEQLDADSESDFFVRGKQAAELESIASCE